MRRRAGLLALVHTAMASVLLASLGCGITVVRAQAVAPIAGPARPVPWTYVKLYAGEAPGRPIQVLGAITVDVIGGGDAVAAQARQDAAALGADAIVQVRLTKIHGYVLRTGLSGIAVRLAP